MTQGEAVIKIGQDEHRHPVYAYLEKIVTVSKGVNSGRVFTPKSWKDKRVIVLLVEK